MDTKDIQIRYEWHPETRRWNYSIVDIIDSVIETSDARNYWKVFKNRLKKRDAKIVDACNQLKLLARDGKYYHTDTADAGTILGIIRELTDTPPPQLQEWIQAVEQTIPELQSARDGSVKKSFPQAVVPRNRLKRFFGKIFGN